MRVLLLGEYSNVHWTLSEGLRALGHEVCVVSNGDFWKNYQRDISLVRNTASKMGTLSYFAKVIAALSRMRGYDVVQLINPMFLELKAERIWPVYRYLRRNNGKLFLGAFGMDYYWVNVCRTTNTFRYSDFNFGEISSNNFLTTSSLVKDGREKISSISTKKRSISSIGRTFTSSITPRLRKRFMSSFSPGT